MGRRNEEGEYYEWKALKLTGRSSTHCKQTKQCRGKRKTKCNVGIKTSRTTERSDWEKAKTAHGTAKQRSRKTSSKGSGKARLKSFERTASYCGQKMLRNWIGNTTLNMFDFRRSAHLISPTANSTDGHARQYQHDDKKAMSGLGQRVAYSAACPRSRRSAITRKMDASHFHERRR
jgi:hypothetical protein